MTITLVTGANKGLGLETTRRLLAAGHTVYLGARDAERGASAARAVGARFVQLDVTDDASVGAAVARIRVEEGRLDVLVNNAGIIGPRKAPADVTANDIREVFDTNLFGVVRVTHAALQLLRASDSPVIVNVSSGLGSISQVVDPENLGFQFPNLNYSSSKAALLMLTVQYAKALPGMRVNAADPGYTSTDLNGNAGTQTVSEGTDAIVRLAQLGLDGPTGGFFDRAGVVPW